MEHDILAFGHDLIAARPRLRKAAQGLVGGDAGRLVMRTMDEAWRARGDRRPEQDLDAWLHGLLRNAARAGPTLEGT